MMEAAHFPHAGYVLNPTYADYRGEAALCRETARVLRVQIWGNRTNNQLRALQFERVAEGMEGVMCRLSWTPAALQQMKDAA